LGVPHFGNRLSRHTGGHVARNPWRARTRLIGAMLAGAAAGIMVGMLLVHLLLSPHTPQP
jgi:hypothetical protein